MDEPEEFIRSYDRNNTMVKISIVPSVSQLKDSANLLQKFIKQSIPIVSLKFKISPSLYSIFVFCKPLFDF